jgi:DNA-binding LacI/PurR family transcriptional regulator
MKNAKIKDVAQLAGVSTATVSHVINNTRFVGEETRQKVLVAIARTNYQPNIYARNLSARNGGGPEVSPARHAKNGGARHIFGLLIPDLGQTEIFEPICQGMAQASRADGHALLWGDSAQHAGPQAEQVKRLCEHYIAQGVAGVFFAPFELTDAKDDMNNWVMDTLARAGIPVVLLDRDLMAYPRRSKFDLVGIDNRRAGYLNAEHLISHGCRRPAFFAYPNSAPTVAARVAGFCDALQAYGLGAGRNRVALSEPENQAAVQSFLREFQPDGIVCANDITAARLMQTLGKAGVKTPQDVRVMGVDDVKYAGLLASPLSTVRQPCLALGEVALVTMLERIHYPALPAREILLDVSLVLRTSCGCNSGE